MKRYAIEQNDMAMMYRALNEIRVQGIVQARAVSIMAAILDGAQEIPEVKCDNSNHKCDNSNAKSDNVNEKSDNVIAKVDNKKEG